LKWWKVLVIYRNFCIKYFRRIHWYKNRLSSTLVLNCQSFKFDKWYRKYNINCKRNNWNEKCVKNSYGTRGPIIFTNKRVLEAYLSITEKYSKLLKEYSEKCRIYFSQNDKNEFNGFCAAEFFKIYVKFKKDIDPDLISEALDELERNLKKREIKKYFLIEKGRNYKGITKYENVDEIFEHEKSNYHNNKVNYEDKYSLKKKITIKDVDDYVKTLSDSYNLIDDNCQTFVRNILNRFE